MAEETIEFVERFLPDAYDFPLREAQVGFPDHYLLMIGRYLAQLHASGLLMRDVSVENVMFRRSNGYPVLIDEPISNTWGMHAHVLAGDFFTPAITLTPEKFQALLTGYVLNGQRLIDARHPGMVRRVLQVIGSRSFDVASPNDDLTFSRISALLGEAGHGAARGVGGFSDEQWLWTIIARNLMGKRADEIAAQLRSIGSPITDRIAGEEFLEIDRTGPEADFLRMVASQADGEGIGSIASHPRRLGALKAMAEAPRTRTWSRAFSKFWMEALCQESLALDGIDAMRSIQSSQTAHVALQHLSFDDATAEDLALTIRCNDAARSWYISPEAGGADLLSHFLAFKNTECNTLGCLAFRGENEARFLHCAFDAIEHNRNLLGNSARLKRVGSGADMVVDHCLTSSLKRLFAVHLRMFAFSAMFPETPYAFGYRKDLWSEDDPPPKDKPGKDSTDKEVDAGLQKKERESPEQERELRWAMSILRALAEGQLKPGEPLLEQLQFHESVYGSGWHTPSDYLGPDGFQVLVQQTEGQKASKLLRSGFGLVVFETLVLGDGRPAQIMERLYPIPGAKMKPGSYVGGKA